MRQADREADGPDRHARRTTGLVLLGCFVCQAGLGCGYIFGVTLKQVVAEFEWSRLQFALANAPVILAMGLAAPVAGSFLERFGARRVLAGSSLLLGLSLVLFSRTDGLAQFVAASVLFGIALTGLGDVTVGSVVARWVSSGRRGLALAVVFLGSNVGGAIVPSLVSGISSGGAWRDAFAAVGFFATIVILPFAVFAVREPPRGGGQGEAPGVSARGEAAGSERSLDLGQAVRTRSFWVLAALLFSFYFYYLAILQHLIPFLSDIGYPDGRAAASLGYAVALGIVSKLGVGLLADRHGARRLLRLNFVLLTVASFLLVYAENPVALTVFLTFHGIAVAAENVVLPLIIVECFGALHIARIFGALSFALFLGVLGPIFAGGVFDRVGDYRFAFVVFAILNTITLALLGRLRDETRL